MAQGLPDLAPPRCIFSQKNKQVDAELRLAHSPGDGLASEARMLFTPAGRNFSSPVVTRPLTGALSRCGRQRLGRPSKTPQCERKPDVARLTVILLVIANFHQGPSRCCHRANCSTQTSPLNLWNQPCVGGVCEFSQFQLPINWEIQRSFYLQRFRER